MCADGRATIGVPFEFPSVCPAINAATLHPRAIALCRQLLDVGPGELRLTMSQVAREAALKIAPQAKIRAFHDNVKSEKFNVDFFKSFSIVLNGLDNLDARRHVNRIALAAKVPLVESGTAGYKGQVTVHRGGETECFECTEKPTPKQYPICTLASTPNKPIHLVHWAKMVCIRLLSRPSPPSILYGTMGKKHITVQD